MKNLILVALFLFCSTDIFPQNFISTESMSKSLLPSDNNKDVVSATKKQLVDNKPGIAFFIELIGKGCYSANMDFRIKNNHRLSVGVTSIDFEVYDISLKNEVQNFWSPSIMYYSLIGKRASFWEFGAGMSISLNQEWEYSKSPMVLHGVIGYRYQMEDGFLFRAGFTPFLQLPDEFNPLIGLSFGYSL